MSSEASAAIQVVATHVWPAQSPTPVACAELELDWGGPVGDRHHGLTMRSDTRQKHVFPRGTEIRNHRQVSLVDTAELDRIAAALGIASIEPGVLADNICLAGLPELTALPRMSRLVFPSGAVLMTGGENFPCTIAGGLVHDRHGTPAQSFPKAAMGLRGITAWVERPGIVKPGDSVTLVAP